MITINISCVSEFVFVPLSFVSKPAEFKLNFWNSDDYDLQSADIDIHVVTGSLKLFFRELMEPLFPLRFFHRFLEAFGETLIDWRYGTSSRN